MPGNQLLLWLERPQYLQKLSSQPIIPGKEIEPSLFESLKHVNEDGVEYWSARELYLYLGYARWQRFEEAIDKAKESCKSAAQCIEDHFTNAGKMIPDA